MSGWFKVERELLRGPAWLLSSPEQKTILITLYGMVNHSQNQWEWEGKLFDLMPGQVITSIESIRLKCGNGVTTQNVRTALARFEKLKILTNESTNQGRLISILSLMGCNDHSQAANKRTNKHLTSDSQAANKHLTTNKNERMKEGKNEKYSPDSIEFRMASYLWQHIKSVHPERPEPDLQKWSIDTDRMLRIDGRDVEDAKELIKKIYKDSFWCRQILSASKLREKFDDLKTRLKSIPQKNNIDEDVKRLLGG